MLIDPATFPDLLTKVVWHLGQPNADPITLSTYALFEQVRDAGFKVALTGDAADELFGGYSRIKAALAVGSGGWVDGYLEALAAISGRLREPLYSAEYRDYLVRRGSEADRIAAQLREPGRGRWETISDFELGSRLPAYHLRRVDHLSTAHGVEARDTAPSRQREGLHGGAPHRTARDPRARGPGPGVRDGSEGRVAARPARRGRRGQRAA